MASVILASPSGGILQGDELTIDVRVGRGARLRVLSQSATRIYRAPAGEARMTVRLEVDPGGYLEDLPDALLHPDFVASPRGPETRIRIIRALQGRDAVAARREIENDIRRALSYVADLADNAGNIAPAPPAASVRRRRRAKPIELRPH